MTMKAFRYVLIVAMTVITLAAHAEFRTAQPQAMFRSTSSGVVCSGSSLPQAAQSGVVFAGSSLPAHSPAFLPGRRFVGESGGWADEDDTEGEKDDPKPDVPSEPYPLPDGTWLLLALAALAALYQRRKAMHPAQQTANA